MTDAEVALWADIGRRVQALEVDLLPLGLVVVQRWNMRARRLDLIIRPGPPPPPPNPGPRLPFDDLEP